MYSVTYCIYEKGDFCDPIVVEVGDYSTVEQLKAETREVLAKALISHKSPDGLYFVEQTILNGEGYYDYDEDYGLFKNGAFKFLMD